MEEDSTRSAAANTVRSPSSELRERPGEMTLIRETSSDAYLGDRQGGVEKCVRRPVDPTATHEFNRRAGVMLAKHSGRVNWVNTRNRTDIGHRQPLSTSHAQFLPECRQPVGHASAARLRVSSYPGKEFENQTFGRKWSDVIAHLQLLS